MKVMTNIRIMILAWRLFCATGNWNMVSSHICCENWAGWHRRNASDLYYRCLRSKFDRELIVLTGLPISC